MSAPIQRLAGIGVGPFNLGLACLAHPIKDLDSVFFERKPAFDWHGNILMTHARMQTPFTADLVTPADPTSPFSFLNFLKQHGRLQAYMIRGDIYPLREEFNQYYQWCANQLENIHFGQAVTDVEYDRSHQHYRVRTHDARNDTTTVTEADALVIGTGTAAYWPACAPRNTKRVIHSSQYLTQRPRIRDSRRIAVVGGGQSGAEVFLDLLQDQDTHDYELLWLTRSTHFFPTEEGKLTLEMTSPAYIEHFFALPPAKRQNLVQAQHNLHKGSRLDTVAEIYDTMYARHVRGTLRAELLPATSLEQIDTEPGTESLRLSLFHNHLETRLAREVDTVILATGYKDALPDFMDSIADRILLDSNGKPDLDLNHAVDINRREIFIQNMDLYTHGFSTSDLSVSYNYNSRILNVVTGRTVYPLDPGIVFQAFSPTSE